MATTTLERWSDRRQAHLWALAVFNAVFALQVLAAIVYGIAFDATPDRLHFFLLPFLWITVSALAVWHTDPPRRRPRARLFGFVVAGSYFLVFLVVSGSIGFAPSTFEGVTGSYGLGIDVGRSLGWGPMLFYAGEWLGIRLIPYQVAGYLALSYLVYATVLNVTKSATAGTLGLLLCPGCAAAMVAPLVGGVAGLSSALTFVLRYTYELSTILFVAAMALLYWQPSLDSLRGFLGR